MNKKITKPKELPCGCLNKEEIENTNFYHKLNGKCNGVLYYGTISGKGIVVCSLCKTIGTLTKFTWFCPKCHKSFISKKVNVFSVEENNNYDSQYNSLSITTTPSVSKKNTSNNDLNKNTNGSRNAKEIHN